jgi:hypothetical protein
MENNTNINPEQGAPDEQAKKPTDINDDGTEFENSDVDPGFVNSDSANKLTGRDDKRSGNIDSTKSVSEMREEFEQKQNDATNLNNDREHGSYNPKNI